MLSKSDLIREVGSLEVLIDVISSELNGAHDAPAPLAKEMQEALEELRLARALRKILLTALDDNRELNLGSSNRIRRSSLTPAA